MAIRLNNIKVHYPGVKALDGVNVDIREGEVHAVIGENGAGKSTLMNVLSGSVRPTEGSIVFDDNDVVFGKPADAVVRGVSLVSQEGTLVPHLSAAANICLGFESTRFGCVLRPNEINRQAAAELVRWFPDTRIDLDSPVESLPFASQKIVEILRALHSSPRVLILDEPTATLPAREKERLWALIRKISHDGVGVILISHFLAEVLNLADHVTALQDGKVVCSVRNENLQERDLVGFMFNRQGNATNARAFDGSAERTFVAGNEPALLAVRDWVGTGYKVDAFDIHKGEVVGLIGLTGAGHADFAASIFETRRAHGGSIKIDGRPCAGLGIRQMKARGVAYVPDHRMINALIGDWSVRENMSLINISNVAMTGLKVIRGIAESRKAQDLGKKLRVKMSSVNQKVSELSGGNKQKVSIARWLYAVNEPTAVFVFVEPTEGVDVGSKREIHQLIVGLAEAGAGVIVVSSDLLEISAVADRVVPFAYGKNGTPILKPQFNEQTFVDAIVGVAA